MQTTDENRSLHLTMNRENSELLSPAIAVPIDRAQLATFPMVSAAIASWDETMKTYEVFSDSNVFYDES